MTQAGVMAGRVQASAYLMWASCALWAVATAAGGDPGDVVGVPPSLPEASSSSSSVGGLPGSLGMGGEFFRQILPGGLAVAGSRPYDIWGPDPRVEVASEALGYFGEDGSPHRPHHHPGPTMTTTTLEDLLQQRCSLKEQKLEELSDEFLAAKTTLLSKVGCGDEPCTELLLVSGGPSELRHPARFGLFRIKSVYENYPTYQNEASGEYFFYKFNFDKWEYAHKIERWLVGPEVGDAKGGIMVLSPTLCPWHIQFDRTQVFYYDKLRENQWNGRGNGWEPDHDFAVVCHDPGRLPAFGCGCEAVNVSSVAGRVEEYHPEALGVYSLVDRDNGGGGGGGVGGGEVAVDGFLAPVFRKEAAAVAPMYLYSHHPSGHLWLIGRSFRSWFLRLNYLDHFPSADKYSDDWQDRLWHNLESTVCPMDGSSKPKVKKTKVKASGAAAAAATSSAPPPVWEYLQSVNGEDQVWLKDAVFKVRCVRKTAAPPA